MIPEQLSLFGPPRPPKKIKEDDTPKPAQPAPKQDSAANNNPEPPPAPTAAEPPVAMTSPTELSLAENAAAQAQAEAPGMENTQSSLPVTNNEGTPSQTQPDTQALPEATSGITNTRFTTVWAPTPKAEPPPITGIGAEPPAATAQPQAQHPASTEPLPDIRAAQPQQLEETDVAINKAEQPLPEPEQEPQPQPETAEPAAQPEASDAPLLQEAVEVIASHTQDEWVSHEAEAAPAQGTEASPAHASVSPAETPEIFEANTTPAPTGDLAPLPQPEQETEPTNEEALAELQTPIGEPTVTTQESQPESPASLPVHAPEQQPQLVAKQALAELDSPDDEPTPAIETTPPENQEQPTAPEGKTNQPESPAQLNIPPDEELFKRQYYNMRETAAMFAVNHSQLRFWENEFDILQPRKNKKGDRYFRPIDIKNLQMIYHLLRVRKFTLEGAKEYLKTRNKALDNFEMVNRLEKLKGFLQELKAHL